MRRAWAAIFGALLLCATDASAQGPALGCLQQGFVGTPSPWPDYGPADAELAPHCYGTNHQKITGVQRVVFLGDSITVGTPNTFYTDVYRNVLADDLASHFGLDDPSIFWQFIDPVNGTSGAEESGDEWASCAKWGALAEDLLAGDNQLSDCFNQGDFLDRTLVVMTIGGNDVKNLADDAEAGATQAQLIAARDQFVQEIDDAIAWLKAPGRFQNGIFVVFANVYDPSDGSGLLPGFCDLTLAPLVPILDLANEAQEMLLQIAVDRDVDMVFMREHFCGHGLNRDDPASTCYRGPGSSAWIDPIDPTCVHPSASGHDTIADDFFATITSAPVPIPVLPNAARLLLVFFLGVFTLRRRCGGAGPRR